MAYEQMCASHHGLTDFRAKLLALFPVASGAGILVLLRRGKLDGLDGVLPAFRVLGTSSGTRSRFSNIEIK